MSLFGSVSARLGTQKSLCSPNEPAFVASAGRMQWQMWLGWNVGVAFSTSITVSELGGL